MKCLINPKNQNDKHDEADKESATGQRLLQKTKSQWFKQIFTFFKRERRGDNHPNASTPRSNNIDALNTTSPHSPVPLCPINASIHQQALEDERRRLFNERRQTRRNNRNVLSATDTRDSVLSTGVRDTIISVDSFYIDGFEPSQRTNNIVEPSSLGRHSRFLESTTPTISKDHSSIIPPRYTTIARPSQHQRSSSMQPTQQRQQQRTTTTIYT